MQMQHPLEELQDRFVLQNADVDVDPAPAGDSLMALPVVCCCKNLLVCPMPKHRSKANIISRVLLCRCVWVGKVFGDFVDLCEKVFLIQYRAGGLIPRRTSFYFTS
jgi:hypothetical protein